MASLTCPPPLRQPCLRLSAVGVSLPGLLLALGALSACSTTHSNQAGALEPVSAPPLVAEPQEAVALPPAVFDAQMLYGVLLGEMSASTGDVRNATALLLDAARQMQSEALYRRAADIALQARSGPLALQAAQAWQQAFPQSRDANRYELQILLMLNRVAESVEPLTRELAATAPNARTAVYLGVAQLYRRVSDPVLAAQVVEQALQSDLHDPAAAPAAWAMVGHMRLAAGQKALALQAALESQRLDPHNGSAALLALELMEAGEYRAESLVQGYLQHSPSATIRLAYARILMDRQRLPQARTELEAVIAQAPELADAWLALASVYAQLGQWDEAEQTLQGLLPLMESLPHEGQRQQINQQASLLGARVALQTQQNARAAYWLQRLPPAPDDLTVQALRATLLLRQGQWPQARALIDDVPVRSTAQALRKRQAQVQLLREAEDYAAAFEMQQALLHDFPDSPDMAYEAALLAEKLGQFDTMEQLLRGILARQPDFHHAYNALGYSLADRGVRLDEARELIETALRHAPGDPFITDSLGWLEYRQGNLAQALTLLELAYSLREDVEIATHLGEVLWVSGQRERALVIWRQAQQREGQNPVLLETLRRLKVSL